MVGNPEVFIPFLRTLVLVDFLAVVRPARASVCAGFSGLTRYFRWVVNPTIPGRESSQGDCNHHAQHWDMSFD
jgi:hypothetical protein